MHMEGLTHHGGVIKVVRYDVYQPARDVFPIALDLPAMDPISVVRVDLDVVTGYQTSSLPGGGAGPAGCSCASTRVAHSMWRYMFRLLFFSRNMYSVQRLSVMT